jgi:hypothetical protein
MCDGAKEIEPHGRGPTHRGGSAHRRALRIATVSQEERCTVCDGGPSMVANLYRCPGLQQTASVRLRSCGHLSGPGRATRLTVSVSPEIERPARRKDVQSDSEFFALVCNPVWLPRIQPDRIVLRECDTLF